MIKRDKGRTKSGKVVTKQQILTAIQKCAEELERAPTHSELMKTIGREQMDRSNALWVLHKGAEGVRSGREAQRRESGDGKTVPGLGDGGT